MRRFALLLFIIPALLVLIPAGAASPAIQLTLPGTNTPPPPALATHTPPRPTPTPPQSAPPTAPPTATNTATNTPTNTPTPTETPSPTPTPVGPFSYPEGVNPLTGLPYPNEEAAARRNLIVKISNFPPLVRPQTGVNLADLVYEVEAEGGVTRFAAIYRNNTPDHVGSVRSARLIDLELVPMYQALLAYSGTSEPIQRLIMSAPFVFQTFSPLKGDNCEDAGFCRFPRDGVAFEHTLFLDTNKVWEVATRRNVNTGFRARGFAFKEERDPNGAPAEDVFIDWYGQTDVRWQYDADTGRYLRYTEGIAHFDAGDGQQLWADNLVIIQVPHQRRPDLFPPGVNYESIEIQLWDQGPAMVIRDGVYYSGFWRRACDARAVEPAPDATPTSEPPNGRECYSEPGTALQLVYGNNQPIMLKPGRSWVSVVRGFGDVIVSGERRDMPATATAIFLNATPTPTVTPGPSPTFDPNS